MTPVFHSTPYKLDDIGGGINEFLSLLPRHAWACIRDADTLFLNGGQQQLIQQIVDENPRFDLIGCMTNRIGVPWQQHNGQISDNDRIGYHARLSTARLLAHGTRITDAPAPIAGFFMLFRVSTWQNIKFEQHTAQFDIRFSKEIVKAGGRLGVAQGLYLWHSYRLGHSDPTKSVDHLRAML